jgi:RNA polymerase sigma factor for flagellar operon FliA
VVESRVSQVHASAVVHLRAALKDLAARGAFEGIRQPRRSAPVRRPAGRETGAGIEGLKPRAATAE